jgi:hypothetical protein
MAAKGEASGVDATTFVAGRVLLTAGLIRNLPSGGWRDGPKAAEIRYVQIESHSSAIVERGIHSQSADSQCGDWSSRRRLLLQISIYDLTTGASR